MKSKNISLLLAALLSVPMVSLPVMAHDESTEVVDCNGHKEMAEGMKEHDHGHEDNDFTRTFKEGTLNLVSPFTFNKDTFYILFSHNFYESTFPKGSNPAFSFSYTPIKNLQLDTILSLRSSPLEWEIGAKYQILNEFEGSPISLTPRIAYNTRGNVLGLDISATKVFFDDIWQIGLGYRALEYFGNKAVDDVSSNFENGIGLNTIVRVWKHWYLFGDVVLPFDSTVIANHGFVWSAGIKKRIPHTPHILTLYVGNSNESTITGRTISIGNGKYPDMLKVGFQFSIGIPSLTKLPEKLF